MHGLIKFENGIKSAWNGWTGEAYHFKNKFNGYAKNKHVSGLGYEGNFYEGSFHDETICTLTNGDIQIG